MLILGYVNSTINPIIYAIMNPGIKSIIKEVWSRMVGMCKRK